MKKMWGHTMSKNERRIREACRKLGQRVESLEWEPITRWLEKEGPRGGWILNGFPIGYNVDEAIARIEASCHSPERKGR